MLVLFMMHLNLDGVQRLICLEGLEHCEVRIVFVQKWCVNLRFHFSLQRNAKVAVCGASGGIGQPLSLLLKGSPHVTELSLYDIVHTLGVAADLSHIDTAATVKGYNGPEQLKVGWWALWFLEISICEGE